MNMKRRELTETELADAARLAAIFDARRKQAADSKRKLTQESVALSCGWAGQSAFGQYVRGYVPLNLDALLKLSRALNFSPEEVSPSLAATLPAVANSQQTVHLDSNSIAPPPETLSNVRQFESAAQARKYPLISWVAAGEWQEACDNFIPGDADEWLASPINAGEHGYWLEVKGPSMLPNFPPGSRVLVRPEGFDLTSGRLYIARLSTGETTFKQYLRDGGVGFLQPLNPAFPIMLIADGVEIIGQVVDGQMPRSFF